MRTGTVVVITGASAGIGRALAHEYAAVGCCVVLAARQPEPLEMVAREVQELGGRALAVPTDVGELGQVQELIRRVDQHSGRIDILINNAGYGVRALMEEISPEDLEAVFRVNVFGMVWLTQAALPMMKQQRGGTIVNIGSVIGRRALPSVGAYCMTKFAVAGFSEALRAEVARHGIHVLQAEPGQTRTDFLERQQQVGEHPPYGYRPGVMSAQRCARKIVAAARRKKDRISLGLGGRTMILANQLAPGLLNAMLRRWASREYHDDQQPGPAC